MLRRHYLIQRFAPHLSFALMTTLLVVLWIAGGASRADVAGQVATRTAAWLILIAFILMVPRPQLRPPGSVAWFVLASVILMAIQLIPLPPVIWTSLPGRSLFERSASVIGDVQPWRPISISPGWTVNALSAAIVPVLVVALTACLSACEHWRIATVLLGLAFASAMLGLLQFSGARFDNPLINDVPGMVSASFANRNHFALFEAIGCVLAPVWAFRETRGVRWKKPVTLVLLLLFVLMILATGSRMGIVLGAMAIGMGLLNVRKQLVEDFRRLHKRYAVALASISILMLLSAIILSVMQGRAISLNRAMSLTAASDLRREALPTVWAMTKHFFPIGIGFGTFDPAYRIFESNALLGPKYFNHAHNDLLEVILEGGVGSLILLSLAIIWWVRRSIAVWRSDSSRQMLPRTGSVILLLIFAASITDYPARTPMVMTIMVIAAVWLNGRQDINPRAGI